MDPTDQKTLEALGVVCAGFALIVWLIALAIRDFRRGRSRAQQPFGAAPMSLASTPFPPLPAAPPPHLAGDGEFESEVVGESKYQGNLATVCGGRSRQAANLETVAHLILEDASPFDPGNAIRVEIGDLIVGYLPREAAKALREWRARQARASIAEAASFTCAALVVGGWDRGEDDRGSFGVRLDVYLGDPPEGAARRRSP